MASSSPKYGEPGKIPRVCLRNDAHIINPSRFRTTTAEINHLLHLLLVSLKDRFYTPVSKVPDPAGDTMGPGFIPYCPSKPDTLYPTADQYAHSDSCCHIRRSAWKNLSVPKFP